MYSALKRLVVGPPLASSDEHHTRLGRPTALTVFASDAISSTAYATEEILLVLVPVAGLAALNDLVPISVVVAILLAIVISSYRQTIHAYPSGGGSYVVSRENLGPNASLVAGASLLVDYVLTVAVSISAGIAAITSAFTSLSALSRRTVSDRPVDHHVRQPARHERVGAALRASGVHVHRQPGHPHRLRPLPRVHRWSRANGPERRGARRDRSRARHGLRQ